MKDFVLFSFRVFVIFFTFQYFNEEIKYLEEEKYGENPFLQDERQRQ